MNRVYNLESIKYNNTVTESCMKRSSYLALSNILENCHLFDFQSIDVLHALAAKQVLLNYDTGMGKTIVASAIMKALHNKDKSKSIFIMKAIQAAQTPEKIKKATGLRCHTVTGERSSIDKFIDKTYFEHDILIVSSSALQSNDFVLELYKRKDLYRCVIVDEIHEMVNYQGTTRGAMLKAILPHFEYRIGLTATTITSDIDQLANAMYMLVRRDTLEPRECIKRMMKYNEPATSVYAGLLIKRTRDQLNIRSDYKPYVVWVQPDQNQIDYTNSGMIGQAHSDGDLFKVMKGPGATNQLNALKRIVTNRKDKGIIYVRLSIIREHVYKELVDSGVRVACIYGATTLSERLKIFKAYSNNLIDVIITSATTSLDIEADYVVFYEFTLDVYQLIGRADRGLKDKRLDIYFIVTRGTAEVSYFIEYIYKRSSLIRHVFRMEPNFIDRATEMLLERG